MPKDLEAVVSAAEMQNTEPKLSYNKTAKVEWNLYTHEKSKHAFKSSSTKAHSSILRLSLRQYVEQQTDITFTLFPVSFTFRNLCKSSSRPCFPVPYGPMQRLCHPAHFFSFVVSQNSFNSIKLQISNPRFPLLLFTLSHTQTHKLHYRSTSLSGYSATLQCCKSRWTPCQPSGSTRCPINMAQGSQRKPSRVD